LLLQFTGQLLLQFTGQLLLQFTGQVTAVHWTVVTAVHWPVVTAVHWTVVTAVHWTVVTAVHWTVLTAVHWTQLNTTADGMKVKNRFHSTVVTKHLERGNGIFVDYQFVEVVFQVISNNLHDDIGDGQKLSIFYYRQFLTTDQGKKIHFKI
jgi:hypothetical protein